MQRYTGTSERPMRATENFGHVVRAPHLVAAVPHTKIIRSRKRGASLSKHQGRSQVKFEPLALLAVSH
jgi:hypothetical protein